MKFDKIKHKFNKLFSFLVIHKKMFILCLGIVFLLTVGTSFARYVYVEIRDFYLASKNFYFNSDKLDDPIARYQIDNWSGVDSYSITFNMNSYKNNSVYAKSDITYDVEYRCSSNITCSISGDYGTIYTSDHTDSFVITINPNTTFSDGDSVWLEVDATSIKPYTKTLHGRFVIKIGKIGLSYEIVDKKNSPYFDFNITNTLDYYIVKEAFDNYEVGDKIDISTYLELSEANRKKCSSSVISLSFDPNKVRLDMTNSNYLNASSVSKEVIDNYDYINGITFKVDALASTVVRFYKEDASMDYTYPFENNTSVIEFNHD